MKCEDCPYLKYDEYGQPYCDIALEVSGVECPFEEGMEE